MKRVLAIILILFFAFCAVPVQPIAEMLSSGGESSENSLCIGNSYIVHQGSVTLTSLSSSEGLFGMPYDENDKTYLWTYSESGILVCDDAALCIADGILSVSDSPENAFTAICTDGTLHFYVSDVEYYIAYTAETNSFSLCDDAEQAASLSVTDKTYIPVTGIELAETETTLEPNTAYMVNAHVLPENATEKGLVFESLAPMIASVDGEGNISALREGTAKIIVTAVDGGFTAEFTVYVSYKYFTVRFFDMDGSVLSEQRVKEGSSAVAPSVPSHIGYDFTGWMPADFTNITSDTDIFSTWSITVYDITFILNGGTCDDFPATYTVESDRIILPTPTRTGYSFMGWYENSDFSGSPVYEIEIGSYGNKVFYADWDVIHYNIYYVLNGGTLPAVYIDSYTIESPDVYPPLPTRLGYVFDGWYSTPTFTDTEVWCIHSGSVGDVRLYASWVPEKYTISYELCGGMFNTVVVSSYTIESDTFSLPVPTRTAYSFSGWYADSSYTGTSTSQIQTGSVGNKTFYAKWTPLRYSITLLSGGGTINSTIPATYTIESDTIMLPSASKRGYDFFGWYENADFTGLPVTEISTGSYGDKTFYARFDVVQYTIIFNTFGGTISDYIPVGYNIESDTIILPVPAKTAYNFDGWYISAAFVGSAVAEIPKGSVGNMTFYAKWTPIVYSITYVTNGAELSPAVTSYTIESSGVLLPTVRKTGYDFQGWFTNPSFEGERVYEISAGSYGDRVFYAKWLPTKYTISYNSNGGTMPASVPTEYNIETQDFLLPVPSKTGYTFGGWYDNEQFSGSSVEKIKKGSIGDIVLYAKWNVIHYNINYNTNGGTITGNVTYTYTIESLSVLLPGVEKRGYDFIGWYLTPDFTGEKITFIKSGSYGDVDVYARFSPTVYTITYYTNGGIITNAPSTYTIESATITLPVPERTAYTFKGWFTSSLLIGTNIRYISTGSVGNITLYAKWTPTVYSITYYSNGGIMPQGDVVHSYTIESDTLALPRPTKTGHVFAGWYLNPEFSGVPITEIKSGSFGELNLYAKWNILSFKVRFFDRDYATLLSEQYVEYGRSANPPSTVPAHYGYYFAGWSGDYTYITSDSDFLAVYELVEYTVTFTDIDLTILDEQRVKHGQSAKAPTPPEHENSVFVFWSCDFSCVTSDLIVTAVYRTVSVAPKPVSEQRFIQFEEMQDGEDYIFCVRSGNTYYALTSLVRFDDKGLWAMPLTRSGNYMKTSDDSADITDALFSAQGNANEGFTLKSQTGGGFIVSDSDYFTVSGAQGSSDVFSYVYKSGAWRLYDRTNNVYLRLSDNASYFTTGTIVKASEIMLFKRINLPEYVMRSSPDLNKIYTIVAVRTDGSAYALTEKDGTLCGTRVEVSEKNIYFYDNIDERTVSFRMAFGNNSKGFSLRSCSCMKYLSTGSGNPTLTKYSENYWKYLQNPTNGCMALIEVNDGTYLCCRADGTFYVGNDADNRTQVFLYERNLPTGRKGDINLDGTVNTGDAVFVLRYCAEMVTMSYEQIVNADANNDGSINTGDVAAILKFSVGCLDWLG